MIVDRSIGSFSMLQANASASRMRSSKRSSRPFVSCVTATSLPRPGYVARPGVVFSPFPTHRAR